MLRSPGIPIRGAAVLLSIFLAIFATAPAMAQTALENLLRGQPSADRALSRTGQPTQAEGGPVAEAAVGKAPDEQQRARPEPFGASLFTSGAPTANDAVNPNYRIQPGDRISLYVWGGINSPEVVAPVDPQGNIFVPDHGPVHVGGVRAGEVQRYLQQVTAKSFTSNVSIYAVVLTSQRVGVRVTGFVKRPGRYGGSGADTVLDYLVRAGGVDPSRGSYRNIAVLRDGHQIAHVDLYKFLLSGTLPDLDLQEGDTIVVAPQKSMVLVDGAVRNDYLFEVADGGAPGSEILALASPLPSATHAVLRGTRKGQPFSEYVTLAQLATTRISDQDQITFVSDAPARTVRVRIEGSRIGPSVLVVGTDDRLPDILKKVQVDPALADLNSVYVLRKSLAEQQRRALRESLDRVERSLFMAMSPTTGVAQIRASEAQLVAGYIQRARQVEPDGLLVVANDAGRLANIRMEEDDVIVIPKRSQVVLVSGEVRSPQAVVFDPRLGISDYVERAGGLAERGRGGKVLVRHASGELVLDSRERPRPGDELIILPNIGGKWFQMGSDLVSLVYQVALGARVVGG